MDDRFPSHGGRGFTLVELAIVLVIIGLLVGGVLAGRDLIFGAQMRQQMKDIDALDAAVLTFKSKYNCLPGDCKNATQFFSATSQPDQVSNGDGDGIISWRVVGSSSQFLFAGGPPGGWEWRSVFDHLAAAKLVNMNTYDETDYATNNRAGYGYPKCSLPGGGQAMGNSIPGTTDCGVILSYEYTGHFFRLGASPGCAGQNANWCTSFYASYTGATALLFDKKFDDGLPSSGNIRAAASGPYQSGTAAWPSAAFYNADLTTEPVSYGMGTGPYRCTPADFSSYDTTQTLPVCSLRIKANF